MASKVLYFVLTITISSSSQLTSTDYCKLENAQTVKCNFIPEDIPEGTSAVFIKNFKDKNKISRIGKSHFQSDNWSNVKYFELNFTASDYGDSPTLESTCFQGLKQLQELHIHIRSSVILHPEAFVGLNSVKLLDMSGCVRLELEDLVESLNGHNKLPALESLILSSIQVFYEPIAIYTLFSALRDKRVTNLDISDTNMSSINVTALSLYMKQLKVLNGSFSRILDIQIDNADIKTLRSVDILDFSDAKFPFSYLQGTFVFIDQTVLFSDFKASTEYLFAPKILNVSACIPESIEVWFKNVTMEIDKPLTWTTQRVIALRNNVKRLEVEARCNKHKISSLKYVNAAENGLEFIHPSLFSCIPNLEIVKLPSNQLFKMMQEDRILFGRLFTSLKYLKSINLSSNNLESIPKDIFLSNLKLEIIDLSHNQLEQVVFTINHLINLRLLNLQYNNIKILGADSMHELNMLEATNTDKKGIVVLKNNPISCAECRAKKFLQWLTVTYLEPGIYCYGENGKENNINNETVQKVQHICRRKAVIISICVSSGFVVFFILVTIAIIYKRRKRMRKEAKRLHCLRKLTEGQGQFEFVAFLSFSSEDADFVDYYVKGNLNENLQLMTGIDRDLVCTGDRYLRPGFFILDETVTCMERSSVVVSVVSNNYCDSRYCQTELDQAYRLNKPIILMIKNHVNENRMMPTMKMLFKDKVRILWTIENGEFVLKTTWDNVCSSMLDIMARDF